ncbi:MAG TPA: C1 family peptidase [Planctomycetaceae bacterium]|nr:C1 family peptidase [Planctomycetaceae bacterium]
MTYDSSIQQSDSCTLNELVSRLLTILAITALGRAAVAADLPAKVDLKPQLQDFGLTARQQGNRDDCSLFAVTGVVEYETARHLSKKGERLSEEFLIWAGDKASGESGDQAMFWKAVAGLNTYGICSEERMPYGPKTRAQRRPSPQAVAEARELAERWQAEWIKRWSVDRRLTDHQLVEIKRALAHGHPVACGLRWPKDLKGFGLLNVPAANQVFDGHSIMFVGYEDSPAKPGGGALTFRNSDGPNWGQQGYGLISYAYAKAYANDALWLRLEAPHSEVPTVRYEAESMRVLAASNCQASPQRMKDFSPKLWSHGEQLFCSAKKEGSVRLGFEVRKSGRYRVRMLATAGPDFGIIAAALDGRNVPGAFDLYCGRVSPAGSLELGTHELAAGPHALRVTSVGKNPASKGFSFGIDALDLVTPK